MGPHPSLMRCCLASGLELEILHRLSSDAVAMPLMVPWARIQRMRSFFLAWVIYKLRCQKEMLETELARMTQIVGKKKIDSIWNMTKDELIEVARNELGMTIVQATTETVVTLREKIRAYRKAVKDAGDPLNSLPPGLDKMHKADLLTEMETRQLPIANQMTRPAMIIAIRDNVEVRQLCLAEEAAAANKRKGGAPKTDKDGDWRVVDDEPKGKGKS